MMIQDIQSESQQLQELRETVISSSQTFYLLEKAKKYKQETPANLIHLVHIFGYDKFNLSGNLVKGYIVTSRITDRMFSFLKENYKKGCIYEVLDFNKHVSY
eukprot:GHVR01086304.1.p1 GENE.GHVR01086304.1~~GHVR01086304.1.p1  ORF type:complete len:102 (+),score=7.15 GHVR01086304.1:2680-2985(+)